LYIGPGRCERAFDICDGADDREDVEPDGGARQCEPRLPPEPRFVSQDLEHIETAARNRKPRAWRRDRTAVTLRCELRRQGFELGAALTVAGDLSCDRADEQRTPVANARRVAVCLDRC